MTAWADHGRRRERGAAGHRAAARQRRVEHRRRPHRGCQARARAAARGTCGGRSWSELTPAAARTSSSQWLTARSRRLHYSVGMTITEDIAGSRSGKSPQRHGRRPMTATARSATAPGSRTSPACWTCPAGQPGCASSSGRNGPHPGAQLRFTDIDGHRFTCLRHRREERPARRPGAAPPPAGPVRGPDPLREGHRAAEPAAEGVRAEPGLVRDRSAGLRAAGLDADARPGRGRPPLGAEAAPPAPVLRRRPARP